MPERFETAQSLMEALTRVGELLEAVGERWEVVIVGGAALNLLGIIARPTVDVDVLATGKGRHPEGLEKPPDPLPGALGEAIRIVARDLRVPEDWMNAKVAGQWQFGLPEGLLRRVEWRHFGGLGVGIASRVDLIHLKLYAACDHPSPRSRHFQDLLKLEPSNEELSRPARWIIAQEPGLESVVSKVVAHVSDSR